MKERLGAQGGRATRERDHAAVDRVERVVRRDRHREQRIERGGRRRRGRVQGQREPLRLERADVGGADAAEPALVGRGHSLIAVPASIAGLPEHPEGEHRYGRVEIERDAEERRDDVVNAMPGAGAEEDRGGEVVVARRRDPARADEARQPVESVRTVDPDDAAMPVSTRLPPVPVFVASVLETMFSAADETMPPPVP